VEDVVSRIRRMESFISPERVYLNPDCGFGTFAERPVADAQTAFAKLSVLVKAADALR